MSEGHFIQRMQPVWEELTALVVRAQRFGPRSLSPDELSRLDRLYRLTTIHLAQVRGRTQNEALLRNLNRLVSKAHSVIYVAPHPNPLTRAVRFYTTGFPRAFARTGRYHAAAAVIFLLGALFGALLTVEEPLGAYVILGPEEIRLPGAPAEQLEAVLRSGRDQSGGEKLMFMSFLLTHNTKVGFTAFALGVLAGVPTVFLMVLNGAMLGAFTTIHHQQGIDAEMWAWLLPHGITEIGAVILCGGAGLMLGMAVVRPGFSTRRERLVSAGREALNLVLGVVPMFILAGFIESFVRQSHWPTADRLWFAAATLGFWMLYFANGYAQERRLRPRSESAAPNL